MSAPTPTNRPLYDIRKMENLHIVFWLIKDICWCMVWRPLGMLMVFPTLIISIIITIRTKKLAAEFYHNMAVTLWITANSYWMASEFGEFDSKIIWKTFTYKHLAIIPFTAGLLILAFYYFVIRNKKAPDAKLI